MHIRPRATAALAAGVVLAGCGASYHKNDPRPPASMVVTASISDQRVSVSPRHFGAGPISMIVINLTSAAQRVTLESNFRRGRGPGLRQETAPISPRDSATLSADVGPGRYLVHVGGDAIVAARLRVGASRPSAQNDLLQP
jgi:hypothetical protein